MKTTQKLGLLITLSVLMTGCITTQSVNLKALQDSNELDIFITSLPDKPYEEIAFIEASGSVFHGSKSLFRSIKQQAQEEGADAIIQVKFTYIPWVLMSIPSAECVAIKYKEE